MDFQCRPHDRWDGLIKKMQRRQCFSQTSLHLLYGMLYQRLKIKAVMAPRQKHARLLTSMSKAIVEGAGIMQAPS